MKQYKTQVIMVSGQMTPNVTPVIDVAIKPENIVICYSDAMKEKTKLLESFFKLKGIKCEVYSLGNAFAFNELQEKFLELASRLENDKDNIAINLTGGTKLMTIAAQLSFADNGFNCFYVIPERDQILMLTGPDKTSYEIQDKLKLTDYFAIHGFTIKKMKQSITVSGESRRLFNELLSNYDKYIESLSTLNGIAALAQSRNTLSVKNEIKEKAWGILQVFFEHGAISYYDDKTVTFKDVESRKFCQGLWLEEYTYLQLSKLNKEIGLQDFACSIEITSPSGTKNEIDAAFLHNNTLYIIECKTAKMDEKGADVLYKIDTIKEYAGMFTKPIVVTMKTLNKYDRQRAKDLKIQLIEGSAVKQLSNKIAKIIKR